jgi:ankyrin repeat protein
MNNNNNNNSNNNSSSSVVNNGVLNLSLTEYCGSASLSAHGLREIIENGQNSDIIKNNQPLGDYSFIFKACQNKKLTEEIIDIILQYFPEAVKEADEWGTTPLHYVCYNESATPKMVRLLIQHHPASIRKRNKSGASVLHSLSVANHLDDTTALEILQLLLDECGDMVKWLASDKKLLALHIAARHTSVAFCQKLIEAYPESVRFIDGRGLTPLSMAVASGDVPLVKFLTNAFPDGMNQKNTSTGLYPIHEAIYLITRSEIPYHHLEIVRFFLNFPNSKVSSHLWEGQLPLALALRGNYNKSESHIDAGLQVVKILYDAFPGAIRHSALIGWIKRHLSLLHPKLIEFVQTQLRYASQAQTHRNMRTLDEIGRYPLHKALIDDNITLGSIKLLVEGNPNAVHAPDNDGAYPLHLACRHNFPTVVEYLADLNAVVLQRINDDGDTPLHYACRNAKYDTIALLLDKYEAVSVFRKNFDQKLPIELLIESDSAIDRESIEYTECIFRLVRAYPDTVSALLNQQPAMAVGQSQNKKKRKLFTPPPNGVKIK